MLELAYMDAHICGIGFSTSMAGNATVVIRRSHVLPLAGMLPGLSSRYSTRHIVLREDLAVQRRSTATEAVGGVSRMRHWCGVP